MNLNSGPVHNFLRCKGIVSYQTTESGQLNFGTCMDVYTIRRIMKDNVVVYGHYRILVKTEISETSQNEPNAIAARKLNVCEHVT